MPIYTTEGYQITLTGHGELGPSQNSAPWRSRPRGELGPSENSAPTTAENSAPTAENSAPAEIPSYRYVKLGVGLNVRSYQERYHEPQ